MWVRLREKLTMNNQMDPFCPDPDAPHPVCGYFSSRMMMYAQAA